VSALDELAAALRVRLIERARRGDAGASAVELIQLWKGAGSRRSLLRGPGRFGDAAWSPDGEWLVVGCPDADQWTFVRAVAGDGTGAARKVVPGLCARFANGARGRAAFPRIRAWRPRG
jgi:hypothetical protein